MVEDLESHHWLKVEVWMLEEAVKDPSLRLNSIWKESVEIDRGKLL